MKKLVLSALAVLGVVTMTNAQFSVYKDGKVIFTTEETPDYVDFSYHKPLKGTANGHEWVDMGLSVKWSSVNVGASNPQDAGGYYAWGETETKDFYDWDTYAHMQSGKSDIYNINKYQANDHKFGGIWYKDAKYHNNGGKTVLDKADDAAAANWQGGWVMPTRADWEELESNCYLVWTTTYNSKSVNGCIVYKAKNDADKGKWVDSGSAPSSDYDVSSDAHIFLPAAGCRRGSNLGSEGSNGLYWSSSLSWQNSDGFNVGFSSYGFSMFYNGYYRSYGQSVRPVCPAQGITNGHDAVDLGLPSGKLWATFNVGASAPEESGDYFAWGETTTKSDYSWETYTGDPAQFIGDNKNVLEASDDVATQSWGDEWRIPTIDEWEELYNNTTREWTDDYNGTGVKGYILTSTKEGHTDASIFLPAAGYRDGSNLSREGSRGYYWSSSLYESDSDYGRSVFFYSGDLGTYYIVDRCDGKSVRPVCPAQNQR